jgi:hypothetical protein
MLTIARVKSGEANQDIASTIRCDGGAGGEALPQQGGSASAGWAC